jgi:hypothetical protein
MYQNDVTSSPHRLSIPRTEGPTLNWLADVAVALCGVVPATLILLLVYVAHRLTGIEISHFTSDPLAIAKAPWYVGGVSTVGLLVWAATSAICLFAGYSRCGDPAAAGFLRGAGWLTLVLLLDDSFMFHEVVAPQLHLAEKLVLAAYAIAASGFLFKHRRQVMRHHPIALVMTMLMFGVSIAADLFLPGMYLLEDGAKLLGISTWCAYLTSAAGMQVRFPAVSVDAGSIMNLQQHAVAVVRGPTWETNQPDSLVLNARPAQRRAA